MFHAGDDNFDGDDEENNVISDNEADEPFKEKPKVAAPPEIVVTKVNKPSSASAFRLHSDMYKAKILVLGPCESGKTVISNFLADATETTMGGDYHPTQGVRILEFENNNIGVGGRNVTAEVELWDVSGDQKFEACWPAIARDTNAVLLVYNPDQPNHDKQLETWHSYFVDNQALRSSQCLILANKRKGRGGDDISAAPLQKIKSMSVNIEDEGDAFRDEFSNFLGGLLSALSDKREQEELSIMNSR